MPNRRHVNEVHRRGPTGLEELSIMLKTFALSAAVAVSALTAMPAAAEAQSRYGYYDRSGYDYRYDRRYDARRYDRRYDARRYDNRRYAGRYDSRRYAGRYDSRRY